jgi:hypothetical protein
MQMSRVVTTAVVAVAAALAMTVGAWADESNKLTYLTVAKTVQLPGITLAPGRYRIELADVVDSRRVIKVASEDGAKQFGLLLTIPNELREPAKDAVVLFSETSAAEPEAVKAYVYPGERIGYEFIYPHDQAVQIAKRAHTRVLSKSGDKLERINENGESSSVDDGKK